MSETLPSHVARGVKRRKEVLRFAMAVATQEGLEALTIGRVAEAAGFTKAGLLGHFTSKEELQLATLRAGRDSFLQSVLSPSAADPPGIVRTYRVLKRWVEHVAASKGGCFFASVAAEYDGRGGAVRDAVEQLVREWMAGLEHFLREAKAAGHLRRAADTADIVFALYAFELALNLRQQLLRDRKAPARAIAGMTATLYQHATAAGRRLLKHEVSTR